MHSSSLENIGVGALQENRELQHLVDQFDHTNLFAAGLLGLTFVALAWVVWRGAGRRGGEGGGQTNERNGEH